MAISLEIRHALRLLRRQKAASVPAIATIAVAIAANTIIFALVRGILLRPLPLHDPDRLVRIEESYGGGPFNLTGATFSDLRERTRTLEAVAAFRTGPGSVSSQERAMQVSSSTITRDYFGVLGIGALRGRLFEPGDFVTGAPAGVVLSRTLWDRLFAGDANAVGRTILVNAAPRLIVGVADVPASAPGSSDIWLPSMNDSPMWRNRRAQLYTVVGRLRPAVTMTSAALELDAIASDIRRADASQRDLALHVTPLADRIVRSIRPTLAILWGAVVVLLLIAFANVANLRLVQGSVRSRELSVRVALGAARGRLARQLIVESAIVGAIGGVAGGALGLWGVPIVRAALPPSIPRLSEVVADPVTLGFGLALSIACSIVFGIVPALRASVRDPIAALRGRDIDTTTSWIRDVLIAAELALTLMLLVGTGLLGRSLLAVWRVPVGFDPAGVATLDLSLPAARYAGAPAHNAFHESVLQRVNALPGVVAAGVTGALPFSPTAATTMVPQDGVPDLQHGADVITASPGFFTTLRVPLVRGRFFTDRDREGAAPVAVINESAVREFWPAGVDPVGRAITMKDWGDPYTAHIVGIVRDVRQASPDQPAVPAVYYPLAQFPETTLVETIVARGTPSVPLLTASIAGVVRSLDRDQPIGITSSMDERMSTTTAQRRINLVLLGAFATAALAIAAVGIYGVVAFALASRTREIGVRLALGARRRHIVAFAFLHGAMPTLAGIAAGLGAALAGAQVLKDLVFAVPVRDPLSAGVAVLAVVLAALAALAGPTRRALRIDPVVALKAE